MLTKRERVHATIRRRGLDAIPWQFDLTASVIEKLKAYYGERDWRVELGDHITFVMPHSPDSAVQDDLPPDLVRSEFGAVWRRSPRDYKVGDWGELIDYPLKEPSLQGYVVPDGSAPGRWPDLASMRTQHPDDFLLAGGGSLFEAGWALCGFENYLSYIAGEPEFVQELTARLADFACALVEQLKGSGLDAVRFGDDWGFQSTLMIRPERWRKLFKPHYRRVYAAAREAGLIVSIHSCGNITELLPDLIEIGVDVVHPLQPEAMDVAFCQREYGRDLTFWGGLGSQSTLPYGTPDDVRREVRQRLDLFRDGGYILAPAGAAPAETPAANIVTIAEMAKSQLIEARVDDTTP